MGPAVIGPSIRDDVSMAESLESLIGRVEACLRVAEKADAVADRPYSSLVRGILWSADQAKTHIEAGHVAAARAWVDDAERNAHEIQAQIDLGGSRGTD
jgi:hypothetical protein